MFHPSFIAKEKNKGVRPDIEDERNTALGDDDKPRKTTFTKVATA
jgi:hypothetical protein